MTRKVFIPRNELLDMNREIDKVYRRAWQMLMTFPGVVAVGVGLKETNGLLRRKLCLKVTVQKKKHRSELKTGELIPSCFEGFATDINQVAHVIPASDSSKYRPLVSGSQIEASDTSGYGTLGCWAKITAAGPNQNKIVLLTNWHLVVESPDTLDNDRIGQPTHSGCCSCCATNEVAKVIDGRFRTDDMDAAIALLDGQETGTTPEYKYINEILGIGFITGATAPVPGETIWKYGSATGLTQGVISNGATVSRVTAYPGYGDTFSLTRAGQYEVNPLIAGDNFFQPNDSGSVSVNEHNQVVLLNHDFDSSTNKMYGTNIMNIQSVLGIEVLNSSFHASVAGKEGIPLSSISTTAGMFSLKTAIEQAEAELANSRVGMRMLEQFKTHRIELLNLVRKNREVMAAWNRYQGPAYLAHIGRNFRQNDKPVPEQIKGITMQSLLLKMTAVLQRNGSPELKRSVMDNYLPIMNVLSAGRTSEEWKEYLFQLDQKTYV